MITVYLHGSLRDKFGEMFRFDVETPKQAIQALISQLKKPLFKTRFIDCLREGNFQLHRGKMDKGTDIGLEEINLKFGRTKEFHIAPVIAGAGGGGIRGVAKIVVGIALIGAAFAFTAGAAAGLGATVLELGGATITGTNLAALGGALILGGIGMMLSPAPKANYDERVEVDERASFLFNGVVNVNSQGVAVPLLYGKFRGGSVVVSTGITTEEM